jgi:hypothetical protein
MAPSKKKYNLLNDKRRLLALQALREGTPPRELKKKLRSAPTASTSAPSGTTSTRKKVLSDKAARLIALAIRNMLNS